VTGGGTYRITGVNADGSYQSQLVNKGQTTRNYGGSYQTRNSQYTTAGVSDYTRNKLNGLESGYTPSGSVQAAQAYLEQVKGSKPGAYQSRWDDELTSLYDQIRNRKKFSYDMGTDPLYQQYREQYQRLGRLAMQDTMGQAAALTGGYGSTYGEQVGQQAYNAYLQKLNDIVPQLQQQAYQRYQDEGTDLYNQYSLVKGREDTDYGRYRDTVSDYYSDLSDARSAYNSERSLDQSQWETMLSYWAQKANNENAAYLQALAAEQAAAKKSGGGGGGGKTSSSGLTDKKNETLAKAAKAYMDKMSSATLKNSKDGVRGTGRTVYLDSRTLDNYLNSKGYNALEANTFKAYLEYYGATYQRQR
jgi:hypothetical protein